MVGRGRPREAVAAAADEEEEEEAELEGAEKVADFLIKQKKDQENFKLDVDLGTFDKQIGMLGMFKDLRKLTVTGVGNYTNYYVIINSFNEKKRTSKLYKFYLESGDERMPFTTVSYEKKVNILLVPYEPRYKTQDNRNNLKYHTYHDPDSKLKTFFEKLYEAFQAADGGGGVPG